MSKGDGFAVMDVSTDLLDDPKFHRLQREDRYVYPVCVVAYLSVLSASWKAGKRVALDDCWPSLLFSWQPAITKASLIKVGLLDRRGMVPARVWADWFGPVSARRAAARERWRRANENRREPREKFRSRRQKDRNEHDLPRGHRAVTASIRSVSSIEDRNGARDPQEGVAAHVPEDFNQEWQELRKAGVV